MYYITMTDKFMSGWGWAKNKINKLIIECETMDQALIVQQNAKDRAEMKYINITNNKPYYNSNRYYVSWHNKDDYSCWFNTERPFKR